MQKGLSISAQDSVRFINTDLKAEGKNEFFVIDDNTEYYCRSFISRDGNTSFTVIYDSKEDLYYMFWKG